jgi:hypothetical protein
MIRSAAAVTAILTLVIVTALVARVPAQQPQAPLQAELLAEVRLLRQAIESLAGTNARVQIVFGRLQLQEQRTATAARRLDDIRSNLSALSMRTGEAGDRLKDIEATINDGRRKPEEIAEAQQVLAMMRREFQRIEAERTRLMNEEAEAAGALNQEQGRWSDLNRQLEELERALAKR